MSYFTEKQDSSSLGEIFPDFSRFERAISYPYYAPGYSFSFYKGSFVKGICHNLDNRIPILSVGSNRSPYQLKRKFSLNADICVTPAILYDSDIVYSASISAYGSMPSTQWPCEGVSVNLNVLWLQENQLNKMHLTEGLGIAYDFVKLKSGTVKIQDFEFKNDIYGYVSVPGVFPFGLKTPKRLSSIHAQNTSLTNLSEKNALISLKDFLNIKGMDLNRWLEKVIKNKDYRLSIHEILKEQAIKPKKPNWQIVKVNAKGDLIV